MNKVISTRRKGVALLLAIIALGILATFALSISYVSMQEVRKSTNQKAMHHARMNAESGLEYMCYTLRKLAFQEGDDYQEQMDNIAAALTAQIDCTLQYDTYYMYIDGTNLSAGESFDCILARMGDEEFQLLCRGMHGDTSRVISVDLDLDETISPAFGYGIASKGKISLRGNASVVGPDDPEAASVLSTWGGAGDTAIRLNGSSVEVSGDLYLSGDQGVSISGNPSIGGTSDPAEYAAHIHNDEGLPVFPTVDISDIAALAVNTLSGKPKKKGGATELTNIRIPAGTNPNFNADMTLSGVIYIESPNKVKFNGHCTVNGIIVTELDPNRNLKNCDLDFAGGMTLNGCGMLGDEYGELADYEGALIIAEGFGVNFSGNMDSVGGIIAADKVWFHGNASGSVTGCILGLTDEEMDINGSPSIEIYIPDDENPPGFGSIFTFDVDLSNYAENVDDDLFQSFTGDY